ncbi:putative sulfate exporter family transporter [Limnohabitans sp. Rim8]|uniref:YeiH family protein n=1 Tax=Limnohabitans sp. Rim8 TaxID=1100718 RepID=UPI0025FF4C13|nr:putative sulfate exporter family transporter [Limnohabitans sp. Rim8]
MANTKNQASVGSARALWHPLTLFETGRALMPGVLVCGVIALASSFISEQYGGPLLLYALLLGLSFHFLHGNPQTKKGVDFCGRAVLRIGVALLGARITFDQVGQLGIQVGLLIASAVVLTILAGVWLAKLLGLNREEGLLSGGAVAICGASAALAISSVLPKTEANERFTLLAVVAVTVLSTLAMIGYPLLTQALLLPAMASGVFLGGTIHDVAQVVAAGMLLGLDVADSATVVKLFRVMLLLPVVMAISMLYRHHALPQQPGNTTPLVPSFLVAFMVFMIASSTGLVPAGLVQTATDTSRMCLVLAIAAVGIKTTLEDLLKLGWRPLLLLVAETLLICTLVLGAVLLNLTGHMG